MIHFQKMILLEINLKNYKMNLTKLLSKKKKTFAKHSTDLSLYKGDMKMTNDNSIVNMGSFGNLFFKGWNTMTRFSKVI